MRNARGAVMFVTLLLIAGITSESPNEGIDVESNSEKAPRVKVVVKRTPLAPSALAPFAPLTPLAPAPFMLPARDQRSAANERWARFIADYAQGQGNDRRNQFPSWAKDAVMVDLPVAGNADGRPSSVPVLVLPVPVPVKDSGRQECSANYDQPVRSGFQQEASYSREGSRRPLPPLRQQAAASPAEYEDEEVPAPAPPPRPAPSQPRRPSAPAPKPFVVLRQPPRAPSPPSVGEAKRSSVVLIEMYRSQRPRAPHMPPVLVRNRRYDAAPEPGPQPPPPRPQPYNAYLPPSRKAPPPPRFDRALLLRGEITVYRADYTEPYSALWDPSGAARVEMHSGMTTTYRTVGNGGQVQRAALTMDRTGEADVIRCTVMRQSPLLPSDRIPPVLPDTTNFAFDGYIEFGNIVAEKWRQTVSGAASENGGVRGEALAFRHELLLMRDANNNAVPLQYSVAVDSSLLGPDCDGYVHRYHEVREEQIDPSLFLIDLERTCGSLEETTETYRVEPLLEFTMLVRDPRYNDQFKSYGEQFDRKYADPSEEAVRKTLFLQNSRFVSSGNRLGATFEMGMNFLSDRLDGELQQILGVVEDDEHFKAEGFPHAKNQLKDLEDKLPPEFDWREKGGVTPVRFQGASCSSCWAFAVAGAVEGALFRKTRRLVALSEQCLVDCAQPYGGNGCMGTWPSHAYDYVQDRGLPALEEYPAYQEKVLQCQDKRVPAVTQISAHVNVTQFSVPALKVAIRRHAPTVVVIDVSLKSFQTYKSGVYYDDRCAKARPNLKHAVLAVGWGLHKGEPHFILKNSWSAAWGAGGYVSVHGPSNTCGVLALPSYPRLEADDVLRQPGGAPATATAPAAPDAD